MLVVVLTLTINGDMVVAMERSRLHYSFTPTTLRLHYIIDWCVRLVPLGPLSTPKSLISDRWNFVIFIHPFQQILIRIFWFTSNPKFYPTRPEPKVPIFYPNRDQRPCTFRGPVPLLAKQGIIVTCHHLFKLPRRAIGILSSTTPLHLHPREYRCLQGVRSSPSKTAIYFLPQD